MEDSLNSVSSPNLDEPNKDLNHNNSFQSPNDTNIASQAEIEIKNSPEPYSSNLVNEPSASHIENTTPSPLSNMNPQPVVKVLSPNGVEYFFMAIALLTFSVGLGSALISFVYGKTGFSNLAVPAALAIVSLPTFSWLFLRLKKREIANPSLVNDASKRRSTQMLQIFNFLVLFFTLIGFVGIVFSKMGGEYKGSILKTMLVTLIVIIISGGILAYYWHDEHK